MKLATLSLLAGVSIFGLASSVVAADLIIEEPAMPGIVAADGDWEGAYAGVHLGYSWGEADHTSGPGFNDMDISGWLVGGQVGYNFYLTEGIVAGIEGDLSWTNIGGECDLSCAIPGITHDINWQGSVRGRVGFDGGAFMPYLTAGLAFANATREAVLADTQTHIGWTVGAGVEMMATQDISLNLEYRYNAFGDAVYATGGISPTVDLTTHQVRAGLNFHF